MNIYFIVTFPRVTLAVLWTRNLQLKEIELVTAVII